MEQKYTNQNILLGANAGESLIDSIKQIVITEEEIEKYPNDLELGNYIRKKFNAQQDNE